MALDVGLARIGVAVCDPLGITVTPLTVLTRASRREDFQRLAELIAREEVTGIICGLPLNMDGSEGAQAQTTRRWAQRLISALTKLLPCPPPLTFWDERLSTAEAEAADGPWRGWNAPNPGADAVAAGVILRSFLDARQEGADVGRYT
jgi:putative Holliday junction resolvase